MRLVRPFQILSVKSVVKDFGSIISYSDSSWSVVVATELDSGHFEFVDEADRPAFIGRQLFNHG